MKILYTILQIALTLLLCFCLWLGLYGTMMLAFFIVWSFFALFGD